MTVEIRVPALGESLTTAHVARWLKQPGDYVRAGETLAELETDKVGIDVPAPCSGLLQDSVPAGKEVEIGSVLGRLDETASPPPDDGKTVPSSATEGRALARQDESHEHQEPVPFHCPNPAPHNSVLPPPAEQGWDGRERRVPMTRLRQTIARNLKAAQNNAAILTTFNEIDVSAVRDLRAVYRDDFEKKHDGARLGFMSFFARAVIGALKDYPVLNAQIDGDEIVYRDFVNLGIAVGTERGLVVPVLHDAGQMSFAELERRIADYGRRARAGTLKLEELSHGTFTITNGGIFGSLLSTPILNAPQSGVLGMHAIQDRPVAVDGQVVIRPMMYVALSYDHRLVDGREAVSFLVRVKQLVEDPRRVLLDL